MPQSHTTDDGVTLIIPGTYVASKVINNQAGTAAAGVVALIGEADEGPDFSQEDDVNSNGYGPDEIGSVQQKYGSGRIVDAFRAIIAAANDPAIVGAVSLVKIIKTNPSVAAAASLSRSGFGGYADLSARREGAPGNLIKYRSESAADEVAPTSGEFAYVPHYSATAVAFSLRQNGSAKIDYSISQLTTGLAFCSAVESLAEGTLAAGGATVAPLTGKTGLNLAAAPVGASVDTLLITLSSAFSSVPEVGDTLLIPAAGDFGAIANSVIIGGSSQNRGAYMVTSVSPGTSSSTVTAKRINAPSGAPAVAAVSATPISANEDDVLIFKKVEVRNITGQDRQSTVGLSGTFNFTVAGSQVTMTPPAAWASQPKAGDTVRVSPAFSTLSAGWYQVLSSTSASMVMTRLSNGSAGSTGSQAVGSPITQSTQPFVVSKPVIDGLAKSMEIIGSISTIWHNRTTTASLSSSNSLALSAVEQQNSLTIGRDTVSDTFISGGDIQLVAACSQEDARMDLLADKIEFYVGATLQFTAMHSQYKTLSDLVTLINSQTTFKAALFAAKWANAKPSDLDRGSFEMSASLSPSYTARIKGDAKDWRDTVNQSGLASAASTQTNPSGLPESQTPDAFLSGGSKSGSSSAQFVAAIDACESVDTNFLIPLVSKDAGDDIADGETESSSSYAVDAVHAYLKSHVIKMSALKARKNRMAIGGRSGAYSAQKAAAASLASFRFGLAFQDVKAVASDGTIKQFQPWMAAIIAGGMQAAAGFKGIVKKFANISGIAKPEGDFNPARPSDLEDALTAGLLILERVPTGGFRWVSDQLTYSVDNNFVFNSLQAVYIADLMALTLIQEFDKAVVGKSVAEISAAAALSFLDGQMFNFRRLSWIAPSDDAPKGYKNASVKINGGVMSIAVEVKINGIIYFVPIAFSISQVQQSASQ